MARTTEEYNLLTFFINLLANIYKLLHRMLSYIFWVYFVFLDATTEILNGLTHLPSLDRPIRYVTII